MSQEETKKFATVVVADADVLTNQDIVLISCPVNSGVRLRVQSITACAAVLPTAALIDAIYRDASANTETTLADDIDGVTGRVGSEGFDVWNGDQVLDPGDSVRALLTGVTAGSVEGLNFTVGYVVEKASR